MSTKNQYIAMAVVFVLIVAYTTFIERVIWPKHPEWNTNGTPAATVQPEMKSAPSANNVPGTGPATTEQTMMSATAPAELHAVGDSQNPLPAVLGSLQPHDPNVAIGLSVSPIGAGLNSVTLNEAKELNAKELYQFQQPYQKDGQELADTRSLATQSITVNGHTIDLLGLAWKLESSSAMAATYGVDIVSSGGKAVLHVSKTYEVEQRASNKGPAGYEVEVRYRIANLSNQPQKVSLTFNGPTMPPREIERSDDRMVNAGYDRGDKTVDVERSTLADYKPGADDKDITANSKQNPFLWAGMSSVYFSAIVRPANPDQKFQSVRASVPNSSDLPEDRRALLSFTTSDAQLGPGEATDIPLAVFFGPKQRSLLESDYYDNFPREYNQLLVTNTGFCGVCTFSWLVDGLVGLLRGFHWIFRDWGVAIILLVLLVRGALHPITKSSQVSMMKMQKMAPEMERLKKKYGDDKEAFAKAQMELYKGMGFTPILGCLPMLLQMPIWFALYSGLQSEYQLRQAPFLWGFTWIHDLARPDRLISFDAHAFTIPILHITVASLNILPLLMAGVMFWQQKTTPQPPSMSPEQETQRKMMQWMTLVFAIFFYPAPSGLNIYILTSSLLGIYESKRIRAHIKAKEEAEKDGKVIVDAKPTRQVKQKKQDADKSDRKLSWWGRMQERIEQIRQEAERKARGE